MNASLVHGIQGRTSFHALRWRASSLGLHLGTQSNMATGVDVSSDPGSSVSQQQSNTPPSKVASSNQGLAGSFKVALSNNMGQITKEAKDNLELQVLILGTIDTYNNEKRLADAAGVSVSENMSQKKARRPDGVAAPTIDPNEKI